MTELLCQIDVVYLYYFIILHYNWKLLLVIRKKGLFSTNPTIFFNHFFLNRAKDLCSSLFLSLPFTLFFTHTRLPHPCSQKPSMHASPSWLMCDLPFVLNSCADGHVLCMQMRVIKPLSLLKQLRPYVKSIKGHCSGWCSEQSPILKDWNYYGGGIVGS